MAQIKLNVQSSDKIKALIGDLGIECEIPVSALVDYAKGEITLQDVCNNGSTATSASFGLIKVSISGGVALQSGTLQDVGVDRAESVTPDANIILNIGGQRYKLAAQTTV